MSEAKAEIGNTEKAFCAMSVQNGFNQALLAYADTSVVKLSDGELPSLGIAQLRKKIGSQKVNGVITWKPIRIEVAQSCDLGYSFGNWEFKTAGDSGDTTYYGNYFTAWKKQSDGKWKYTLDGGNNTPKPY